MSASVVLATRNRPNELRDLLNSLRQQSVDLEVLVLDDNDGDQTREMVASEFPEIRYFRLGSAMGPAFQRNRGIELARNNIVFPLDDDTQLPSPDTIRQTLTEFSNPRVAAVGIPFINVLQDDTVRQRAPDSRKEYAIHAFVGASHAVRRDRFLEVGGYRESLFYAGEEGDVCLRMLNKGYVTKVGLADPIHHFESPNRDSRLAARYGRRNDVTLVWHNAPAGWVAPSLLVTSWNGVNFAMKARLRDENLAGLVEGYRSILSGKCDRAPVHSQVYALYRRLKKSASPIELEDVVSSLPKALRS